VQIKKPLSELKIDHRKRRIIVVGKKIRVVGINKTVGEIKKTLCGLY